MSWRGHSNHPKGRQCPTTDIPTQDRTDRNQNHPNKQAKATRTERRTTHQRGAGQGKDRIQLIEIRSQKPALNKQQWSDRITQGGEVLVLAFKILAK